MTRELLSSPLDDLPQFVGEDGAGQRVLQRDQPPRVEREERLVHGLHAKLRAGLDRRVNLVRLRLANQVPDGRRGHHDLHRGHTAEFLQRRPARSLAVPAAAATVRRSDRPAMNCMLGSNCCETTASSTAASCTRICCCWYGGKTSMIRSTDCAALAVCNVAKTRWPVSAMVSAAEMVSRSRISPTMITLGSSRSTARSALGKVWVSNPSSRWLIMLFL